MEQSLPHKREFLSFCVRDKVFSIFTLGITGSCLVMSINEKIIAQVLFPKGTELENGTTNGLAIETPDFESVLLNLLRVKNSLLLLLSC